MNENSRPKKRIPYWRALIVGILIPVIGGFLFAILMSYGAFTAWKPFEGPPSGIAQIITIQWDRNGKVWVKANDGAYYSGNLLCYGNSGEASYVFVPILLYHNWKSIKDISQIPQENILRGRNCTSLRMDIFPFNPAGPIRECFYTYQKGYLGGNLIYIALMADGSLKFWESAGNIVIGIFFGLLSIPLSFVVAVIISVTYLIKYLIQHIRRINQGRKQPQPTGST